MGVLVSLAWSRWETRFTGRKSASRKTRLRASRLERMLGTTGARVGGEGRAVESAVAMEVCNERRRKAVAAIAVELEARARRARGRAPCSHTW